MTSVSVVGRESSGTSGPLPFSWQPSQIWDGNDGAWSSFFIRVGDPAQAVRVLPSTAGQATWVVMTESCQPSDPDCADARGGLVNLNQSTSRKDLGIYYLDLERNLGHNASGDYGLDQLALGEGPTGGSPTLDSQVVIGIQTNRYRVGITGLNQQATNVSNFTHPYPSLLTTLRTQNSIPSLSWGYTAGASYRSKGVFGSLTLGGYDLSRFNPNNVSFDFAQDLARDLVVGLQSIVVTYGNHSSEALLPFPILSYIDSTIPYIYLPTAACQVFEKELGLVWNSTNNLYFVKKNLRQKLLGSNPQFTFTIGNNKTGQPTVDIVLPYASFDQIIKPPFVEESTSYFPIRRAINESQYTLGRVFLQEAYLITNYEHNNFSVAQARFEDNVPTDIIPIPSRNDISQRYRQLLGTSGIVGVSVGSFVVLVTLVLIFYCALKRRRKNAEDRSHQFLQSPKSDSQPNAPLSISTQEIGRNSLHTVNHELQDSGIVEMDDQYILAEMGNDIAELPQSPAPGVKTEQRVSYEVARTAHETYFRTASSQVSTQENLERRHPAALGATVEMWAIPKALKLTPKSSRNDRRNLSTPVAISKYNLNAPISSRCRPIMDDSTPRDLADPMISSTRSSL